VGIDEVDIRDIIEGSPPGAIAIRWPAGAIGRWPERGKSPAAAAGRTPSRCGTISAPNIGRPKPSVREAPDEARRDGGVVAILQGKGGIRRNR
jgi:hypothetical protein